MPLTNVAGHLFGARIFGRNFTDASAWQVIGWIRRPAFHVVLRLLHPDVSYS